MNGVADAAMSIDIINGSDGINFSSGSQSFIQQGVAERLGGVVATAGGAGEFAAFFSYKGAGNDTSDAVGLYMFIGNFAEPV